MTGVVPRAVELHGVSMSFGDVLAVDNLSFSANPGEVTGFWDLTDRVLVIDPCTRDCPEECSDGTSPTKEPMVLQVKRC
jgi:hypothetical protein